MILCEPLHISPNLIKPSVTAMCVYVCKSRKELADRICIEQEFRAGRKWEAERNMRSKLLKIGLLTILRDYWIFFHKAQERSRIQYYLDLKELGVPS